jgi:hypothetical protein
MNHAVCRIFATGWHEGLALAPYAQTMRPEGEMASGGAASDGAASGGAARGGGARGGAASGGAAAFRSALDDLEAGLDLQRGLRPELTFEQEPAPRKLAPFAASVTVTVHDGDGEIGWGRFVLLYDPAGQHGWGGPFRIIAHLRVDLEPEIAADPLIGEVGWSWLTEALDARAVGYQLTSGTVTRVVTEGFGAKQGEPATTEFELRASWSPAWHKPGAAAPGTAVPVAAAAGTGEPDALGLDGHIAAWCEALCAAAGLPPLAAGVSALRQRRGRRQR